MTTVTFPTVARSGSDENLVMSTDEESVDEEQLRLPVIHGSLNKWTNYLHGWQERFLVLKEGTLSYFKCESDLKVGCRGALRLVNAVITPHKYDECRFEVARSDSIWYLRASNEDERQRWVDALELHRGASAAAAESGYGSENNLRRQNSLLSLTSTASLSTASVSSIKRGLGLKEKLMEMETFKEILNKQVDGLQAYFDACAGLVPDSPLDQALEDSEETEEEDAANELDLMACDPGPAEEGAANAPPQRGFLSRFLPFGRAAGSPTGPALPASPPPKLRPQFEEQQRDIYAVLREHGQMAPDFKGNAYTFKATTAGILANLGHCIDLMQQREELWRRRVEREAERRRRAEEAFRGLAGASSAAGEAAGAQLGHRRLGSGGLPSSFAPCPARGPKLGGPDLEEGPGCALGEEEFFDAVDAQLDKLAEDEARAADLKRQTSGLEAASGEEGEPVPLEHPLREEIEGLTRRHLRTTDLELQNLQGWTLLHQSGNCRMYKRIDGAPYDDLRAGDSPARRSPLSPLKAVHVASGLTAKEVCRYFFDLRYRREWETTLDQAPRVLELPGRHTIVVHQIYRRIWPATQRDACFWSHLRRVPDPNGGADLWMVVNRSTDHLAPPLDPSRMLRLWLSVAMVAQTVMPEACDGPPERSQLSCKIQYTASLDPGGWVPQGAAKAIYEREYPKFLTRFTEYVYSKCHNEPPDL